MAGKRKLPRWSRNDVVKFVAENTDAEIAAMFDTTRQGVAKWRRSYDPPIDSPRTRGNYTQIIPWTTAEAHLWDYDARMLRLDARSQTGGELSIVESQQLGKWQRELTTAHLVVDYTRERGHFYVGRRPEDVGYARRP